MRDDTVIVRWKDNAEGESGYEVHRKGPSDPVFGLAAALPADTEEYTDTELTEGTYQYRVRATGPEGVSAFAGPVQVAVGVRFRRGDSNADGKPIDISDAVYILQYLFASGPAIPHPHPACGVDLTADELGCLDYEPCREQ